MTLHINSGNLTRLIKFTHSNNIHDATRIVKRNKAHLIDYSMKSLYEIPENIKNSFHFANASLWDNLMYFFHSGVQISFGDILKDLKQIHPQINELNANKTIDSVIKLLSSCKNVIEITYPIEKENGKIDIINAFRVQHTIYRQPCMGGVRLCEKINVADLKGLASLITFQNSNLNLPFGGSFGGIAINPSNYCLRDLRRIITTYGIECAKHGFLDPAKDVFQPDLNLSSREMSWMTDSFLQTIGHNNVNSYAAVLGKPTNRKGIQNYKEAAADAVYYAISNILMDNEKMTVLNLTPNWCDKTYVIHGFGRVGQSIAECFYSTGARCVGIQERDGVAIFNSEGISIPNLIQHFKEHKTILGFVDAQEYQSDIIGYCSDILVLAGPEKTIHCFNVQNITSKIVVEAAFCAITPTAHKTLMTKNALVLPDILVATGCQIAAYMEYLKNINHISFGQIGKEPIRSPYLNNEVEMQRVIAEETGETVISAEDTVAVPENTLHLNKLSKMRLNYDFNEGEIVKNVVETNIIRSIEEINETTDKYGLGMDLRMASYVCAIRRIVNAYFDTGKFDNFFYDEHKQ